MNEYEQRELLEECESVIRIAAAQVARRYRGYLTFSDLMQEGSLWVLKHPTTARERLDDGRRGSRRLIGSIARHLDRLGRQEKAYSLRYEPEDEVFYSTSMVESLLPAVWDDSQFTIPPTTEEVGLSGGGDPAEGGGWMVSAIDVRSAWANAPIEHTVRVAMAYRYAYGLRNYQIAELLEVSDSTVAGLLRKGLAQIIDELGGFAPRRCYEDCECGEGVGSRRVMSNAEAQARTAENYGG